MALPQGMTGLVTSHWDDIDAAVTKRLKRLGEGRRSALAPVDPKDGMLGCGHWGCAYPTIYAGWTVKVSADPLEGPVVAAVMDDEELHNHPGTAYIVDIWRLPKKVRGKRDVWVILREDIEPAAEYRRNHKAIILLHQMRIMGTHLNKHPESVNADRAWWRLLKKAERMRQTRLVADFMRLFRERMGGVLADLHHGNVGIRRHDLSDISPGHKPRRGDPWVAFDLGHSSVHPTVDIPVLRNPGVKVLPCLGY